MPAFAETYDDSKSGTVRLDSAREQRIAGGQKREVVETGAPQADRTRVLHDEKIAAAAAFVTRPLAVQWLDNHQFRCAAHFLRQALTLFLRKLGRNPMGAVQFFNRRVSALAEAQRLSPWRPRDVVGLTRGQPLGGRP